MKCFICVVFLLSAATGRAADNRQLDEMSVLWVAYYAATYHVPLELVEAVIDEESGWNPNAISSKGAAGIMQLMPATAIRFGVHNRLRLDENIRGGIAYLAWLMEKFKGDLRLVTAAYYVGEGPIISRGLAYSCADVQSYVARVARRYRSRRLLIARSPVPAASKLWR